MFILIFKEVLIILRLRTLETRSILVRGAVPLNVFYNKTRLFNSQLTTKENLILYHERVMSNAFNGSLVGKHFKIIGTNELDTVCTCVVPYWKENTFVTWSRGMSQMSGIF